MRSRSLEDYITNSVYAGFGSSSVIDALQSLITSSLTAHFNNHIIIQNHDSIIPEQLYYWLDETMVGKCIVLLFDDNAPLHGFFASSDDALLFKLRWE